MPSGINIKRWFLKIKFSGVSLTCSVLKKYRFGPLLDRESLKNIISFGLLIEGKKLRISLYFQRRTDVNSKKKGLGVLRIDDIKLIFLKARHFLPRPLRHNISLK